MCVSVRVVFRHVRPPRPKHWHGDRPASRMDVRCHSPMTYVSSRASVSVSSEADRAVHFQLQQRWGLLKVNSGLVTLLRGRGRGGGEYTVPDVRG